MWKFNFKMTRDKWFLVLAAGLCLMVLAMPSGGRKGTSSGSTEAPAQSAQGGGDGGKTYERQLEDRVKKILSTVDGVGKVDVMIVLKSSEEKILRTDRSKSVSESDELDSDGASRSVKSSDTQESTVLTGNGAGSAPIVEKELKPEIEGIIVSAQGGGNAVIKEEISAALEALFHVPRHKIRVLKRVE